MIGMSPGMTMTTMMMMIRTEKIILLTATTGMMKTEKTSGMRGIDSFYSAGIIRCQMRKMSLYIKKRCFVVLSGIMTNV